MKVDCSYKEPFLSSLHQLMRVDKLMEAVYDSVVHDMFMIKSYANKVHGLKMT